jgi:hypothetical protein
MLNATLAPTALGRRWQFHGTERFPSQATRTALDEESTRTRLLVQYIEGWAKADPVKIAGATAPGYRFDDPLVGTFSTLALPRYFETLRSRSGLGGCVPRQHLSFLLSGPMDGPPERGALEFWREASRLGLTGTSLITVGSLGVSSERVAYDLNMASDQLRKPN